MDGETSDEGYQASEVPSVEGSEGAVPEWEQMGLSYDEWIEAQLAGQEQSRKLPSRIPRSVAAGLVFLAMAAAAKFGFDKAKEIMDPISGAVGAPGLVPPSAQVQEGGVVPTEKKQAELIATVVSATRTPTPTPEPQRTEKALPAGELPSLPAEVVMRYLAFLNSDPNLEKAANSYIREPGAEALVIAGPRKNWENPVPMGNYHGEGAKEYKPGWGSGTVLTLKDITPFKLYRIPLPDGRMTTDSYVALGPDGRVIFNVVGKNPVNKSGYQVFQGTPGVAVYSEAEGKPGIVYGGGMSVQKTGESVDPKGRKSLTVSFGVYGIQPFEVGSEPPRESPSTPQESYPDAGRGR